MVMRGRAIRNSNLEAARTLIERELVRMQGKARKELRIVLRTLWGVADRLEKVIGDESSSRSNSSRRRASGGSACMLPTSTRTVTRPSAPSDTDTDVMSGASFASPVASAKDALALASAEAAPTRTAAETAATARSRTDDLAPIAGV